MTDLKLIALALASAGALAAGCATGSAGGPLPAYSETRSEKATATVTAIDQATRQVTLRAEDGQVFDFVAGDQVRNLAQVQVGDQVVVEYTESIALEVRRGDGSQPEMNVGVTASAARPGEQPQGSIGKEVTISASIEAIDRTSLKVTLRGPQGNLRILQVKDPKKLENVKVGDMVFVTYTQALGISLEKVAPAATPSK
jgi:Cu/Ag efflux protein CusF